VSESDSVHPAEGWLIREGRDGDPTWAIGYELAGEILWEDEYRTRVAAIRATQFYASLEAVIDALEAHNREWSVREDE
jgi:hypothetical protein